MANLNTAATDLGDGKILMPDGTILQNGVSAVAEPDEPNEARVTLSAGVLKKLGEHGIASDESLSALSDEELEGFGLTVKQIENVRAVYGAYQAA